MTRWPKIQLSQLGAGGRAFAMGPFGSRIKTDNFRSSGVPVLRGKNLSGNRFDDSDVVFVDRAKAEELAASIAQPGDLVFTHRGTLGQVALVPRRPRYPLYLVSQSQMKVTLDEERVLPEYVYYWFCSPEGQHALLRNTSQTGVPAISQPLTSLQAIAIPLPPLSEQRAIVEVLGALDDKIEANRRVRTFADRLLSALFRQVVAPALDTMGEVNPFTHGWRRASLESVLAVLETGSRPKGGVSTYSQGIPSLGAESVLGLAQFDFSKTKYVPVDFFKNMKRGIVADRDVLLYKDGGRPGEFEPHVSILGMGFPFGEFCINEHVYRLRAAAPLTQEFLYYWLASEPILEEMRQRGTGVAIPGLNSTAVKGLPIDIPPVEVIERFSLVADPTVTLALRAAHESRLLAQLRDALLPKLLSGELRVRDAESLVGEAV